MTKGHGVPAVPSCHACCITACQSTALILMHSSSWAARGCPCLL